MESKPLIIGITGAFGSGKSEAACFFEQKGYKSISLVSFLEEEAKKRGVKKITRKILQDLGNEWREKYGSGILAKKALESLQKNKIKKAVIEGFRNIGEINELKEKSRFILLGIVVNRKIRFERLKNLKRREDLTWKLFEELDSKDLGIGEEKTGLQVAICLALSDYFIENNGSKIEFKDKLKTFLKGLE